MYLSNRYRSYSLIFISFAIALGCTKTTQPHTPSFKNSAQKEVFELMMDVFKYEVRSFSTYSNTNDWQNSVFFIGAMAAYEKTGYEPFIKESYAWAKANHWKLGDRKFHADDQAAGQVYLALYKVLGESYMILDLLTEAGDMIHLKKDELLWWWADALFMAPPALVDLSIVLETNQFISFTNKEWNKTHNLLYNEEDSLFYRDKKKYNHIDKMGRKVYWLRGNGWVIAGLAKMLNTLSPKDPFYEKYMSVYLKMAEKLVSLQSDDGLWRSGLLRPKEYPVPDASGSALICYALAWGVNNDILPKQVYEKTMLNCWKGLKSKITAKGKLQSVQPVGHEPTHFSPNNSEIFGSGAFLLASSQLFVFFGQDN